MAIAGTRATCCSVMAGSIEYNKRAPRPEMEYIDYGLGILSAAVLERLSRQISRSIWPRSITSCRSPDNWLGYEVHERFYEIGSHQGMKETEAYFVKRGNA